MTISICDAQLSSGSGAPLRKPVHIYHTQVVWDRPGSRPEQAAISVAKSYLLAHPHAFAIMASMRMASLRPLAGGALISQQGGRQLRHSFSRLPHSRLQDGRPRTRTCRIGFGVCAQHPARACMTELFSCSHNRSPCRTTLLVRRPAWTSV